MLLEMKIGMIGELNMAVATKSTDWWYNFGTTIRVYNDKSLFKRYAEVERTKEVVMRNANSAIVSGIDKWNSSSSLKRNWFSQTFFTFLKLEKICIRKFVMQENG